MKDPQDPNGQRNFRTRQLILDHLRRHCAAADLVRFFSGSETALTAASRGKLRSQADKGARGAQRALQITEDSERLIGSVLLGNNLVNILAASLATALFTKIFGESGVALATIVMTMLVLVFAEVLPKTYAITNSEKAAAAVAPVIGTLVTILAPIVGAVRLLVRGVLRVFGVQIDPDSHIMAVREEIVGALQIGHSEGVVEKEDPRSYPWRAGSLRPLG